MRYYLVIHGVGGRFDSVETQWQEVTPEALEEMRAKLEAHARGETPHNGLIVKRADHEHYIPPERLRQSMITLIVELL